MRKYLSIIFLITCKIIFTDTFSQNNVRIFGKVTDFNNKPLDSVIVIVKDKSFNNLYETFTNDSGYFSLNIPPNLYYCIYAIKPSEYGKNKLEYWAWNIPAYNDLEINPKYDRIEVYGMNAFEPQVGPFETYMIYFRPMSLTKFQKIQSIISKLDTIDITPKITYSDITAFINNIQTNVVSLNKVLEYARGKYVYGYLVQIKKPSKIPEKNTEYDKISIIIHSKETNEYGMGECFVKKDFN